MPRKLVSTEDLAAMSRPELEFACSSLAKQLAGLQDSIASLKGQVRAAEKNTAHAESETSDYRKRMQDAQDEAAKLRLVQVDGFMPRLVRVARALSAMQPPRTNDSTERTPVMVLSINPHSGDEEWSFGTLKTATTFRRLNHTLSFISMERLVLEKFKDACYAREQWLKQATEITQSVPTPKQEE